MVGPRKMRNESGRNARVVQRRYFRPPLALFLWVLVIVALISAAPPMAFASGEERTTVEDDLLIRTDTRWAGGSLGGYLPVRLEISNQGPARVLSLEVTPSDRGQGATVKRVVTVEKNATVRLTLSVPLISFRQGLLRVYDRRGELPTHMRVVGGGTLFGVETAPAMLVVSSRPVDCTGYIRASGSLRDVVRFTRRLPQTHPRLRKWSRPTACPIRGLITADLISSPFRARTSQTSRNRRDRRS